jgi:predicted dehydrogenase
MVIASPSHYHLDDLEACIDADKPCLVEKPLGLIGQGYRARNLTFQADRPPVAVGFNLRFHPDIMALKNEIKPLDPFYASFVCAQYCDNKDGVTDGCLNHWACHELDLALHLLGPALRVIDKHVDHFSVDLGLQQWEGSRCHVHIHSDMRAHGWVRRVLVVGDDASYNVDLEADRVTNGHYKAELAAFIASVESGKLQPPLASIEDGLAVLELCERIDGHGRYKISHDTKKKSA